MDLTWYCQWKFQTDPCEKNLTQLKILKNWGTESNRQGDYGSPSIVIRKEKEAKWKGRDWSFLSKIRMSYIQTTTQDWNMRQLLRNVSLIYYLLLYFKRSCNVLNRMEISLLAKNKSNLKMFSNILNGNNPFPNKWAKLWVNFIMLEHLNRTRRLPLV